MSINRKKLPNKQFFHVVNGDGDFDNFISIFYNIEYSLMSKVKPNKLRGGCRYGTNCFKPPMSKVKLNIVAIGIAAYLHLTKCFKPPMSKVKHTNKKLEKKLRNVSNLQ